MIYTVTLNPSLDYIIDVTHFEPGMVNRTTAEKIFAGGKGINVSMVLKNLGFDSTALGFLAGFTGKEIERQLEEKGISTDFICLEDGISRINMKIRSEVESEINGLGPEISSEAIKKMFDRLDELQEGDILVLAGSIPASMPESMYRDIMKRLADRKLKIAVDATKSLLLNVLPFHPFVIKPNNHELGELFNVKIKSKDQAVEYAKKLQEMGAQNVIVSMAGEGAVFVGDDGSVFQSEAPKGTVVNSVGAGDSMVAGFLAGYLGEGDYQEAFKLGVCTGSASAFSEQLATREQVEAIRNTHHFQF
ncbi:1-phosphofructokinase [Roseburia sp. CAG:309]|nr:1-phosphofructokinase [Roseburia sp. CAG:309]